MRFIDLTHPLRDAQPVFASDPPVSIVWHGTIQNLRYNLSAISLGSHQGTHVDAMFHFVPEGKTVDQLPLDWLFGPARLMRIPKRAGEDITTEELRRFEDRLQPGGRIVLDSGWHRQFGTDAYFVNPPSLTQDAAQYLAERRLRVLGMDLPTPGRDYYEIHHVLLGNDVEMVLVESMANLDQLPDVPFTLCTFPLRLEGRDGSPIRAVAILD